MWKVDEGGRMRRRFWGQGWEGYFFFKFGGCEGGGVRVGFGGREGER